MTKGFRYANSVLKSSILPPELHPVGTAMRREALTLLASLPYLRRFIRNACGLSSKKFDTHIDDQPTT